MRAVIVDSDGTGKEAWNTQVTMAGKTGTGEWHDSPKDYVAWFAGFAPATNPQYAYAAVYEGDPGDKPSGGTSVAPIVGDVFEKIYRIKKAGDEMPEGNADDGETEETRKVVVSSRRKRSGNSNGSGVASTAKPQEAPPAAAEAPRRAGLSGWWKRITKKGGKPTSPGGSP